MNRYRLIVTLAALGLASCGSARQLRPEAAPPAASSRASVAQAAPTSSTPADQSQAVDSYPIGSGLDSVLLNGKTLTAIENQVQQAVAECMTAKGFPYDAVDASVVMSGEDSTMSLADVRSSRVKDGYGITESRLTNPNLEYFKSLDMTAQAAWADAIGNFGEDGCRGTAEAAVYKGIPFFDPSYAWTHYAFEVELKDSSQLTAAFVGWSTCMSEKGFAYNDPITAQQNLRDQSQSPDADLAALHATELTVAAADTSCYSDNVQPVKMQVESEILQRWVSDGKLSADLLAVGGK